MLLASLLVGAAFSVTGASPASGDAAGDLRTAQGHCLSAYAPLERFACGYGLPTVYNLIIVARVNGDPRYQVRSLNFSGACLVAYASNGNPDLTSCNSNYADQVWGFQYVRSEGTAPLYWLRNKHSGKCLALNPSYQREVFMTTCANYRDQLWHAPN